MWYRSKTSQHLFGHIECPKLEGDLLIQNFEHNYGHMPTTLPHESCFFYTKLDQSAVD